MKKIKGTFESAIAAAMAMLSRLTKYFVKPAGSNKQVTIPPDPSQELELSTFFELFDLAKKPLGSRSFRMASATLEEKFLQKLRISHLEQILPLQDSVALQDALRIQLAIGYSEIPEEGMNFIRDFFYRDQD